jgi:hypothetical protein
MDCVSCWKFRDTIQAQFLEDSFSERKQRLIEHFWTRTSLERPLSVRSVTIFADLDQMVLDASHETHTISMPIIGYVVQTKQSRKSAMTNWIKSTEWEPVSGGLFSNSEYSNYLEYAKNRQCRCTIFKKGIWEGHSRNSGELSETTMREIRLLLHIQEEQEFILPTLISAYAHSCLGHQKLACLISCKLLAPLFVVL